MTPEREAQILSAALRREEKRSLKDLEDVATAGPDETITNIRDRIADFLARISTAQQYVSDVVELAVKVENPAP